MEIFGAARIGCVLKCVRGDRSRSTGPKPRMLQRGAGQESEKGISPIILQQQ
jgi:hypothetical protein